MHIQEQMEYYFLLREKEIQNTWQKGAWFSLQSHESHCDIGSTYMKKIAQKGRSVNKKIEIEELSILTVRDWIIKKLELMTNCTVNLQVFKQKM